MALKELGLQKLMLDFSKRVVSSYYINNSDIKTRGFDVYILKDGIAYDCTGASLKLYVRTVNKEVFEAVGTTVDASKGHYEVFAPEGMDGGVAKGEIILSNGAETIGSFLIPVEIITSLISDGTISEAPGANILFQVIKNEPTRIINEQERIIEEQKRKEEYALLVQQVRDTVMNNNEEIINEITGATNAATNLCEDALDGLNTIVDDNNGKYYKMIMINGELYYEEVEPDPTPPITGTILIDISNLKSGKYDKTGGTITGNIMINKDVPDIQLKQSDWHRAAIYKNASSTNDFGTRIEDLTDNVASLMVLQNGRFEIHKYVNGVLAGYVVLADIGNPVQTTGMVRFSEEQNGVIVSTMIPVSSCNLKNLEITNITVWNVQDYPQLINKFEVNKRGDGFYLHAYDADVKSVFTGKTSEVHFTVS
jgi:hypothetical protein